MGNENPQVSTAGMPADIQNAAMAGQQAVATKMAEVNQAITDSKKPEIKRPPNLNDDTVAIPFESLSEPMKQKFSWMLKAKQTAYGGYSVTQPWKLNFGTANYAEICKGDKPMRIIPFVWWEDPATYETWAVFDKYQFIGKKPAGMFDAKRWTLMIPFDKSPDMCDYHGRTYIARFDELTERQISRFTKQTAEEILKRAEDHLAASELEQIRGLLLSQTKGVVNWKGLIKVALILVICGISGYVILTTPNLINGLTHIL